MSLTSDLLIQMEDIDDILSNVDISGTTGANQDRSIRSLNRTQDLLERFIGVKRDILATVDDSISQTVGQEFTSLPTRTLRIDSVWMLNASTSLPTYEITPERNPGGHRLSSSYPLFNSSSASTGRPNSYWRAHGSDKLYWDRQPNTTNNIRVIGFFGAADITLVPDSTFAYDDSFIVPFAAVAAKIFRLRRREDWQELQSYADQHFQPVLDQMVHSWRHQEGELRGSYPCW